MKASSILKGISLVVILLPQLLFAQDSSNSSGLLEFLMGDGAFESWFFEVFTQMDHDLESRALSASMLGRTLGGIGSLIYLGYLGFQMQEGARPWEITPMLRPFVIGLILLHWTGFYKMIQYPLEQLAVPSREAFLGLEREANKVRIERFTKQTQLLDFLIQQQAHEKAKERELALGEDSGFSQRMIEGMSELFQPIEEWKIRMDFESQKFTADLIEAICLTLLRVCTYLVFFLQKVWSYILILLGPIALGISLIPGFEHSFQNWVSKFINVNLYTFVAFTIVSLGQQLIISGYHLEMERYDRLLDSGTVTDLTTLSYYISNNGLIHTVLFPCVAYLVTGIGILMTPTIADSIVSAAGAGVMSKGKAGAGKLLSASSGAARQIFQSVKSSYRSSGQSRKG
ncbi:type IV secretion system protein [Chryseobacterium sp. A321]